MRILGLDYGDATIGVAVSDQLGLTAQGVTVIRRPDEASIKKSIAALKALIAEYQITSIVLGFPKNLDNSQGLRCEKTLTFKCRLERNFKRIPVILWDERLSTVAASRFLKDAGASGRETRSVIDKMAAVYILQGYLDYIRSEQDGGSK